MLMFNTYEAKAKLSSLIKAALNGEEIVIAYSNNPAVKIVPCNPSIGNGFEFRVMCGEITINSDLDAPLPKDVLALFEGKTSDLLLLLTHLRFSCPQISLLRPLTFLTCFASTQLTSKPFDSNNSYKGIQYTLVDSMATVSIPQSLSHFTILCKHVNR